MALSIQTDLEIIKTSSMAPNLKPTHQSPRWYRPLPWELAICNVIPLWPLEKPFQTNHVSPNTPGFTSGSWLGLSSSTNNNLALLLLSFSFSRFSSFSGWTTKERDLLLIASKIEKPSGAVGGYVRGNETVALEAAGDCQSGFACPGCALAGIKELAGQARPQSPAQWIRAEAGDSQGPALQLRPNAGL